MKSLSLPTIILIMVLAFSCQHPNEPFDEIVYSVDSGWGGSNYRDMFMYIKHDKSVFMTKTLAYSISGKNDSLIMQTAILDDEIFQELFNIKIDNIEARELIIEDSAFPYISFIKDKKVVHRIDSYRHLISKELQDVLNTLGDGTDTSIFKNLREIRPSNKICGNKNGYIFSKGGMYENPFGIGQPECYLLTNYLCEAMPKDTILTTGLNLYTMFTPMYINKIKQPVTKFITDGRYYCLETEKGDFMTLDIGVNFLTHTMKPYYEAWAKGKKNYYELE